MTAAPSLDIRTRHLCNFSIDFDEVQYIATDAGLRINYIVKEGVVTGDRFAGEFVAGGGDWIVLGSDGVARLDVRATILADDGSLVFLTNSGRVDLRDTALRDRMAAGEALAWSDLYARSAPLFETSSEKYGWLNSIVTVALNGFAPQHVDYAVYEVC